MKMTRQQRRKMERENEKQRRKEEQKAENVRNIETPDPFIEPSEDESLWRYMGFAINGRTIGAV